VRTVQIPEGLLERIKLEARAGYPEETCGFLFSAENDADGSNRTVSSVEAAPNEVGGERRRRFIISPGELRSAEARAAARGEVVSGFYHSHPDHPAVPSAFDAEHAWPWYTYLVVAVEDDGAGAVGAFELESGCPSFYPCELAVVPAPPQDRRPGLAPGARS
jgi:proteasome lid subunit RPN8/RPN11